jgi:hypothetical protein
VLGDGGAVTLDGVAPGDAVVPALFKTLRTDPAALLVTWIDLEACCDRCD